MEKLTLEQIAPFLPHGLKGTFSTLPKGNRFTISGYETDDDEALEFIYVIGNCGPYGGQKDLIHNFIPYLREMDLTKPIIVEGKEVIPIVELAKIVIPNPSEEAFGGMNWFEYEGEAVLYDTGMESGYLLKYVNGCFILEGHDYSAYCPNQYVLFQWLAKHKFDFMGLIPLGLAIDVNILVTNHYN